MKGDNTLEDKYSYYKNEINKMLDAEKQNVIEYYQNKIIELIKKIDDEKCLNDIYHYSLALSENKS